MIRPRRMKAEVNDGNSADFYCYQGRREFRDIGSKRFGHVGCHDKCRIERSLGWG